MPTQHRRGPTSSTQKRAHEVLLDAQAKSVKGGAKATALVALVRRRMARITEDFYDMGEALRTLMREALYKPLGYASFDELLEREKLPRHTQARKLIAVVDSFGREQALALGLEKSFAVITYAAATPTHEIPQLVVNTGIEGRPLEKMSVRQIVSKATTLRARHANPKAVSPDEKRALAALRSWQSSVRKAGLRTTTTALRHIEGHAFAEIRVPIEELERWFERSKR